MLDFQTGAFETLDTPTHELVPKENDGVRHPLKRIVEWIFACLLLTLLIPIAVILTLLNPFLNAGPLWFVQRRMGYRCKPFMAIKFRTMTASDGPARGAFDALDVHRITALGRLLRKMRIDELPQIINVLRGEMTLIGPRPDAYDHASVYLQTVPRYRSRYNVMPGISGLAQTEVGYVDGLEGVRRKVAVDLHYIAHADGWLDSWIVWRTLVVVLTRRGA